MLATSKGQPRDGDLKEGKPSGRPGPGRAVYRPKVRPDVPGLPETPGQACGMSGDPSGSSVRP